MAHTILAHAHALPTHAHACEQIWLNTNWVHCYQVTKLTVIPVTLAINALTYGVHTTTKTKLSLAILLAGVGVATVSEVQLRPLGMIYGILAVLSTAICQIWQGSTQKEFGVSATQLQAATAPWMSVQALSVAVIMEMAPGLGDMPYDFFDASQA